MAEISQQRVLDALRAVCPPRQDQDVVALGMVSGVAIKDSNVMVSLEVAPERGPAMEDARQAAEKAIVEMPGVTSATVMLTAKAAPPSDGQGRSGAAPAGRGGGKRLIPGVRRVIAVASGKGGVGKSTMAANLALALAADGLKVGVLDADVYGPSMPRMLGIDGRPESRDGKTLEPMENYGLKVMSIGFLVDEATPMIWRGPMVMSALEQMLRDVNWGELDALIVDMPPGTGDAQLTMAQRVPMSGAVIVSTPQDIALIDARKGLNMFRKTEVRVLGIVENMSYYLCPSCGCRAEIFGHGGARKEAQRMGCPFLGEAPLHLDIRVQSDSGRPTVVADPNGEHAQAFRRIARKMWEQLELADDADHGRAAPRIVAG